MPAVARYIYDINIVVALHHWRTTFHNQFIIKWFQENVVEKLQREITSIAGGLVLVIFLTFTALGELDPVQKFII